MEEEKGFRLSLAIPGEKLLEKMWDSLTSNAIVPAIKPWFISRDGRAQAEVRRYEVLALAQAKADAADIKCGRKRFDTNGKLIAIPGTAKSDPTLPLFPGERVEPKLDMGLVVAAATTARAADIVRAEVNVAQTVLVAEGMLAESSEPTPEDAVDDDWLLTWRDHVSKVSSEKLQHLWASALAGEVAAPGSYSIRTLDFLRTLSQKEAEEISKIAQFFIQGNIVKDVDPILKDGGLTFGELLQVQELGVISGVGVTGLATTFSSEHNDKFMRALRSHDKILIIERDEIIDLRLKVYKFTALGNEIMRLGKFKANTDYLRNVGKKIAALGYTVMIADVIGATKNVVEYQNAENIPI